MDKIERLESVAQELSLIRQQVRQVAFQTPIDSDSELRLLISKGKIARNIQPLIAELGNPQNLRSSLIKSLRQIVSLHQLSQMANMELRTIEKELHRHQLHLYKWLGELRA
ncbi:MAG: hypothetical protein ACE14V_05660 [bacterium]